jgi:hypothetical protein
MGLYRLLKTSLNYLKILNLDFYRKEVKDMANEKARAKPSGSKPCPTTGPAHDGRGQGKGVPGGSRRGRRK